ncbi:PREDICTED: neurotrypsin-like [Amphimedon queenslandica]|uniref:SRCR domain-containing protein n=1 Tax=Amphimedon queenslandica TaxID=400682 RepID=A0A1X7U428_AMPQE|nr:PREDICTED: neurotrypsin-like [Amphimedon queenslandica]|eukprot:XP_019856293.1 PREDICTED: neurotrypsin-like [Amphimedon queenslandica]
MELFDHPDALVLLLVLLNHANAQGDGPSLGRGLGSIRLFDNRTDLLHPSAGIVQIYYYRANTSDMGWGNICDNIKDSNDDLSFNINDASVICNQLGYSGALKFDTTTSFGTDSLPAVIYDVNCTTNKYLTLRQCAFKTSNASFVCEDSDDVYVECNTTRIWSRPYAGQIRVQGSDYSNFGRLEVYCNGQWGTVCEDTFTEIDARVACRQLGYSTVQSFEGSGNHLYGPSSQPVWLNDVRCHSSHKCISYCQICPRSSRNHYCNYNEVVILGCEFNRNAIQSSNTLSTCQNANSAAAILVIIIIVVSIISCLVSTACVIGLPMCICFCLGVGIGSSRSKKKGYNVSKATDPNAGGPSAGGDAEGGSQPPPQEQEKPPQEEEKFPEGKTPEHEDNEFEMKSKNKDEQPEQ